MPLKAFGWWLIIVLVCGGWIVFCYVLPGPAQGNRRLHRRRDADARSLNALGWDFERGKFWSDRD
jgi:hypothetical protein